MITALYSSLLIAYLILFFAIVSRLNTGLDKARSINVRGIMTVAAVLLLGWPVLLARLAATNVFASWHHPYPLMWLAMLIPVLGGIVVTLFPIMRAAGKQLPTRDFVWPLIGHFALAFGYYYIFRLINETEQINFWTILAGSHFFLGITSLWLSFYKNISQKLFLQTWHVLGIIAVLAGLIFIGSAIPRHISTNSGLHKVDISMAQLPLIWLPTMLLPLFLSVHVWGLGHISFTNSSKTV